LAPANDPVASPSGNIYDKEVIYKYLLAKIKELKRAKKAYQKQLAADAAKAKKEAKSRKRKAIDKFLSAEGSQTGAEAPDAGLDPKQFFKERTEDAKRKRLDSVESTLSSSMDRTSRAEQRKGLKRTSFWLPEFTPGAEKDRLTKPKKRPPSPFSGKSLKIKDLIPIKFALDDARKPMCAVSHKQITTQPVVLIRTTGAVILKECFESLVQPSMVCPVTNEAFKAKDVVELQSGRSSYAASGAVEATKWRPSG